MAERVTKRQQRAAATAEQLLIAARTVFEARGYQATTVGAITEAANTAHGTFYLYFKNKEDAFGKVISSVLQKIWDRTRTAIDGDPYDALLEVNRNYLEVFSEHRGLWRCLHEGMHRNKAVEAMWAELRRPFVERLEHVLRGFADEGKLRPVDPRLTAFALASLAEWFAFTSIVLEQPAPSEAGVDELAQAMTSLWFHGVFPDAPTGQEGDRAEPA